MATEDAAGGGEGCQDPGYGFLQAESARLIGEALGSVGGQLFAATDTELLDEFVLKAGEALDREHGRQVVSQVVQSWPVGPTWKHCIDASKADGAGGAAGPRFCYTTTWSTPTRRRPIPNATACVSFAVEAQGSDVRVVYHVEGQRLAHTAGTAFKEQWLHDVLESKRLLHGAIDLD